MAQSRKKQIESMLKQQKELNPDSSYVKIVKYTFTDPVTIPKAVELFTTHDPSYTASVRINDEWIDIGATSGRAIEKFREHGIPTNVSMHDFHSKVEEVEGIPVSVSPYANFYRTGVIVEIAYKGVDEEEADDRRRAIEPEFKKILHMHGIPLDRVCISSSYMCENLWAKHGNSKFHERYVTKNTVAGCEI